VKILLLHNRYRQRGGEDVAVHAERDLLRQYGHEVRLVEVDNADIDGLYSRLRIAAEAVYSPGARRRVAGEIAAFEPDIVHVHNFFPLLSPGVYYACREAHVPVVQTLHNYRLICPKALLFRDGQVCEECVGRSFAWPGIAHACYRGSRAGTASIAVMQLAHRISGTWHECVDMYIALSEFSREKFVQGGLPAEKIAVKPNFASRQGPKGNGRGGYALFVGRLSPEKGIEVLLAAWKRLTRQFPISIVGDGPPSERTRLAAAGSGVTHLGARTKEEVTGLMRDAAFLILPSLCYENFPLVIAEAFEAGLPVIASDLGALGSLVTPWRTGLLFRPGDPGALAEQVEWALAHPRELSHMRHQARAEYEAKYTPERNYELLRATYDRVLEAAGGGNK
jgi:glycosyltransferase involved in cell wall biosynthesis